MAGPQKTVSKKAVSEKSTPHKIILERISSKNSSSDVFATNNDYLTLLPPEILLKIIPLLPATCFCELAHTSSHLRAFMKLHAATICNNAIEQRFSHISTPLDTQYMNGWLVPSKSMFSKMEETLRKRKINLLRGESGRVWKSSHLRIQLTDPGPQYLLFLETIAPFMDPCYVFIGPTHGLPFQRFGVIPYEQMLDCGLSGYIYDFVKGKDEILAKVLCNWGHWERQLNNARGLSWYYGAPESAA